METKFNTKFLVFGCVHAPYQDEKHIEEIVKFNQDNKPQVVVCNGDLFEASAASRWVKEGKESLQKEYEKGSLILKKIREVNPNAEYFFNEGNHDANIMAEGRLADDIRDLVDFNVPQFVSTGSNKYKQINEEFINHWNRRVKYVKHRTRGGLRFGAVFITHGFMADANSDKEEARYFNYNWPHSLCIRSHTHRPTEGVAKQVMWTAKRPLPYYYLNTGLCGDMEKMTYMDRVSREMWGNGFVYGSFDLIKSPRFKKTWDAECVVTKWFEG